MVQPANLGVKSRVSSKISLKTFLVWNIFINFTP